jgi:hypothetical protein
LIFTQPVLYEFPLIRTEVREDDDLAAWQAVGVRLVFQSSVTFQTKAGLSRAATVSMRLATRCTWM